MTPIERVADVLRANDDKFSHIPWHYLNDRSKSMFASDAKAAIAAMLPMGREGTLTALEEDARIYLQAALDEG